MTKLCMICGAGFSAPPTSKKLTCSSECSRARKRATHLGKRNVWTEESREALSQRGQTRNLALGTPAAKISPVAGPYETNQEAKTWYLHSPRGVRYEVRNLRKFIRDHPEVFEGEARYAYGGILSVQRWVMGRTKQTISQWKGWTLERGAHK